MGMSSKIDVNSLSSLEPSVLSVATRSTTGSTREGSAVKDDEGGEGSNIEITSKSLSGRFKCSEIRASLTTVSTTGRGGTGVGKRTCGGAAARISGGGSGGGDGVVTTEGGDGRTVVLTRNGDVPSPSSQSSEEVTTPSKAEAG